MAKAPAKTATPTSGADAASLLQARFDAGAGQDELLKLAQELNYIVSPDELQAAVEYRDRGGKGAGFVAPATQELAPPIVAETPAPELTPVPLEEAIRAARRVFAEEPSLGLDPSRRAELEQLGFLGRTLYAPAADIGAAGLTAALALLQGAATGTGQFLQNIGVLPVASEVLGERITPQRFAEQSLGLIDFALMKYPMGIPMPTPVRAAPVSPGRIATALERAELPPTPRATAMPELPRIAEVAAPVTPPPVARPRPAVVPEAPAMPAPSAAELPTMTPGEGRAALESMAEQGMTQPIPKLDLSGKVADFAADYLQLGQLKRPADMPFSEFFYRHVKAGTVPEDQFRELVQKYNLTDQDVMELFTGTRQGLGDAARTMQRFSVASRYVPTEAAELAKLGVQQADDLSLWRRMTNVYRGALVSNMATTMRNNISSLARVPLDTVTNLMDSAVNTAANPFRAEKVGVNPLDAFAVITDRFNPAQNKKFYDQLRNVQPAINKELMATYSADVARVTKKDAFSKAEKAIDTVNLFNRVSETATRKAMFPVYLRREATRLGVDFDELVYADNLQALPEEAFSNALRSTLDFTYSAPPTRDSLADLFVRTVEKGGLPLATVIPFPRFMANAMKFQFDHSPAGFFRLLSKAEQEKFAKGDTSAVSKAMLGSTLLYAAYEFRNSDTAGEKWYEAKTPSGKTFDLRPFFPAAPYLLVADIIKRRLDGSIDLAFEAKDVLQGLTGAQFRAGGGLYVADELIRDLGNAGTNTEKAARIAKTWIANLGAGFLQPFQQFKDFYAQYNPEEAVYRDAKDSFLGTLLRAVPGAQRALGVPEAEMTTREGPSTTVDPALRQLLGVTIKQEKNFLESEIDRLGLTPYELGPKTGDPEMDRLINRDLGLIAERAIVPLIESEPYKQLDDVRKVQAIRDIYTKARDAAVTKFETENPELALIKSLKRRNRTEKVLINRAFQEKTGKSAEQFLRQLREAPLVRTQEQYDALPDGTNYTDPGDYKVYTKGE